jgi:hypothetical protein
MANRYMKKCSTSLVVREMQIQTTVRKQLTLIKMVIIKMIKDNKCWQRCGEKKILAHPWWVCELVWLLLEDNIKVLGKLKIDLPSNPPIPL